MNIKNPQAEKSLSSPVSRASRLLHILVHEVIRRRVCIAVKVFGSGSARVIVCPVAFRPRIQGNSKHVDN
jgi:hypothetical protein